MPSGSSLKTSKAHFGSLDRGDIGVEASAAIIKMHSKLLRPTDGLANSSVRDIFQDNTGTLWFATGWGVSRYDGQKFNNFVFDGPYGDEHPT